MVTRKVVIEMETEGDSFRGPRGFLNRSAVADRLRWLADRLELPLPPSDQGVGGGVTTFMTLYDTNGNKIGECHIEE